MAFILIALFGWTIWNFRNQLIFQNVKCNKETFRIVWTHALTKLGNLQILETEQYSNMWDRNLKSIQSTNVAVISFAVQ